MQTFIETFLTYILGNQTPTQFCALLFFALLAAALSLLLQTTKRDIDSENTPLHFSWQFLWQDNIKRIVTSLILIYVAIRFTPQLFGVEISDFWAFVIGFINDKLAQFIKDKAGALTNLNKQ